MATELSTKSWPVHNLPAGLDLFVVKFRDMAGPSVMENAALTASGVLHLDVVDPWEQAHGPLAAVESISRRNVCRGQNFTTPSFPPDYCHEPRRIAVAFDYDHPFSNQILTNGFSFAVKVIGQQPSTFDLDAFEDQVRLGFQLGISAWTSGLADHDEILTPAARAFVMARTSVSNNGYKLLLPPQVIQLECAQNATFSIALVFDSRELFPEYPLTIARAKLEGRTLALNMRDISCFRTELKFGANGQPPFQFADDCVNLVPILTHELGHAFGLHHADKDGSPSIMDSHFSYAALKPTKADLAALVLVLDRSIQGESPGTLEFVSSSGVMPPVGWRPPGIAGPPAAAPPK